MTSDKLAFVQDILAVNQLESLTSGNNIRLNENNNVEINNFVNNSQILLNQNGNLSQTANGNSQVSVNGTNINYRFSVNPAENITEFYSDLTAPGTLHALVAVNGDLENSTGTYGTISDRRVKTDVSKSSSQWEDIKKVNVVNYKLKNKPEEKLIGVIAQELEEISPGLVNTKQMKLNKDEEEQEIKTVKMSIMYMKLLKAFQEAQLKIEKLEQVIKSHFPHEDLSVDEKEYEDKYKHLEKEVVVVEKEVEMVEEAGEVEEEDVEKWVVEEDLSKYLNDGWEVSEDQSMI